MNRTKDPLIGGARRFDKALVRLAVDIERGRLAAVVGPPPMGLIVEHSTERHANEIRVASDAVGQ